jgi:pyruvate/2-oxoglutarate/acetoin dehydrogenase E1 component
MEGGIGPVAGSSHHSLYYRMPGVKIVSPMSPREYKIIYNSFLKDNDVYYVSEHRGSYNNTNDLPNIYFEKPDFVIFAISITRFESMKAQKILLSKGMKVSLINILWIKPLKISKKSLNNLKYSKFGGMVIDDDYTDGVAKSIANDLTMKTKRFVTTMGLKNKTAGFGKNKDNLPPSAIQIVKKINKIIKNVF